MHAVAKKFLTPDEIAAERGISVDTVHAWCRSGELRAINCSTKPNSLRPRYRITVAEMERFDKHRARSTGSESSTTEKSERRTRRKLPSVKEYIQ